VDARAEDEHQVRHDVVPPIQERVAGDLLALPAEYMSAVSKLISRSTAAWMIRTQSAVSGLPPDPSIIVPRH